MSEIVNEFRVFHYLPQNISKDIRSFYVTHEDLKTYGYCVTHEDRVYGVGKDIRLILGYNQSYDIRFTLIPELCDLNIEEFFGGINGWFARSKANEIYYWGSNKVDRQSSSKALMPQKLDYFDDKNIIEMSCGLDQCLALSSSFLLYRWNIDSEMNIDQGKYVLRPVVFELSDNRNNIQTIQCTNDSSFAMIFNGDIYELSAIRWKFLININEMIKECKESESIDPTKHLKTEIIGPHKVQYKFDNNSVIICETIDGVYKCHLKNKTTERVHYKNLFEYFLFEKQSTYKTIQMRDNQLYVFNNIKSSEESILLKSLDQIYSNVQDFYKNLTKKSETLSKLRSFRVIDDLPKNIESGVKCYYSSGEWDSPKNFAFFVMTDDSVYGWGYNDQGKLGLGYDRDVQDYVLIPELSHQNIEEFYEGTYFMLAKNDKNQIFGWGQNDYGKFKRKYTTEPSLCLKPYKIDYFDDKNIIDVRCGVSHCLALGPDGSIYAWGLNIYDDNSMYMAKFDSSPRIIEEQNKFKYIYCISYQTYALTTDGELFCWGDLEVKRIEELIKKDKLIKVNKIVQLRTLCIILTEEGIVYKIDLISDEIKQIKCETEFTDIYEQGQIIALQSEECVYELEDKTNLLIKTNYIRFYDFYLYKHNLLYKTIHISSDGYISTKEIIFEERNKRRQINILKSEFKNVFGSRFENNFDQVCEIGRGSFANVYKVRDKTNNTFWALKRIETDDNLSDILRQVQLFLKLKSDFVVQYIDVWIEGKVIFNRIKHFMFIQMELCSHNLRQIIQLMDNICEERFTTFQYFISCELFRELTECVHYLHSLKPPIIHRDIKPENVLFSSGSNGRFLKLGGLMLTTLDDKPNHTRMVGTLKYIAPEVMSTGQYNYKVDIYSLAITAIEIFNFETIVEKLKVIQSSVQDNISADKRENQLSNISDSDDIKIQESSFHSEHMWSRDYMAPEIRDSRRNNINTIFTDFALISKELSHQAKKSRSNLLNYLDNYNKVVDTLSNCLLKDYNQRPNSRQLLESMSKWTVNTNTVLMDKNLAHFNSKLSESMFTPLKLFFETKTQENIDKEPQRIQELPVQESQMGDSPMQGFNYHMKHESRGKCIIFNNKVFDMSTQLYERHGTEMDGQALFNCFKDLKFNVEMYSDLSVRQIMEVLNAVSKQDHSHSDCLIVCVLTHGNGDKLWARDQMYPSESLFGLFERNRCMSLAGKPKIFFIQSCRETKDKRYIESKTMDTRVTCPTSADFLIAHIPFSGYISWKILPQISFNIKTLTDILTKHSSSTDLLTMLILVNQIIVTEYQLHYDEKLHEHMASIMIFSTLTRNINFNK